MRAEELQGDGVVSLVGLRTWSDAKGMGWIAQRGLPSGKTEARWVSAQTWGSWRLAFLLARLQRDLWVRMVYSAPICSSGTAAAS
mmetsp:Transcript_101975/g.273777  ORF Transcript_101975/g.273777 Transcript_101975/m.273777 type:complete len:85 (-) Transcript_101975:60-314(-)